MPAIRAEMPGIFALSTSISCFHVGGPPSVICADLLSTSERNFQEFFARYPALTLSGLIRHTKPKLSMRVLREFSFKYF